METAPVNPPTPTPAAPAVAPAVPGPAPSPGVVNTAPALPPAAGAGEPKVSGAPFRSAALYVGDLHADTTEATLFEIFHAVAPVASVRVCRHAITRKSLGYAYVNFHTVRDAERVLDTMNYTVIKGRMARLMWSQRDPSLRKSGQANVFIKSLDPSIDSKDLFDTFSIFGNIISCKVVTDKTGASKGYGFVHFETQDAANEAIQKVNGNVISGRVVYVGNFLKRGERMSTQAWTNLYVKGLPTTWDEEKLKAVFSEFGAIASALIVKDKDGVSRGFGYVDYEDHDSAALAVEELNNKVLEEAKSAETEPETEGEKKSPEADKKLYVARFMKKRERERIVQEAKTKEKSERIKTFLGKNLYIRNLADGVTDEQLREEFAAFGTITSARVMKDESSRCRGFGFVCFSQREEAAKALHTLNNMMFMGKPLYVALWQPRDERRQYLTRQRFAKGGPQQMQQGRQMMPPMGMAGYQMSALGMYPQGPRGAYPRPMYNQRMPPRGYQHQHQHGYLPPQPVPVYGGMIPGAQGTARGPRRGPGPRQHQHMQHQRNYAPTQQARNMQQMPVPPQQQQQPEGERAALTATALAAASLGDQKNMIGERLYPLVHAEQPDLAGKVTGMLLDGMETTELLHLLESPDALRNKITEAMEVLAASTQQDDSQNADSTQ